MTWMRCSACKRDIKFGAAHWVCSVSTCNRRNTDYKFCSVSCWDSHVAILRHRDAWAVEARAPSQEAWAKELAENPPEPSAAPAPATPAPRRVIAESSSSSAAPSSSSPASSAGGDVKLAEAEKEVLI